MKGLHHILPSLRFHVFWIECLILQDFNAYFETHKHTQICVYFFLKVVIKAKSIKKIGKWWAIWSGLQYF